MQNAIIPKISNINTPKIISHTTIPNKPIIIENNDANTAYKLFELDAKIPAILITSFLLLKAGLK